MRGSHSAALEEANWEEIATFVVDGTVPPESGALHRDRQELWGRLLGYFSWLFWILLPIASRPLSAELFLVILSYVMDSLGYRDPYVFATCQTLVIVVYVWLIFKFFTRF